MINIFAKPPEVMELKLTIMMDPLLKTWRMHNSSGIKNISIIKQRVYFQKH